MPETDEILKLFREREVKFVRPFFVDILGRLLDFTLPVDGFEDFVKNGKGFDGSSVEGFARTEESDILFVPDLSTLRILPWQYSDGTRAWREAVVFGCVHNTDRSLSASDTRALLMNLLDKYKEYGTLKCGAELEFFVFKNSRAPSHTDAGGYFRSGNYGELRKGVQLALNEMGIKTEFDHHEVAQSQHEIDLMYDDALRTADKIILTKYVIKRMAKNFGVHATFMPKPIENINGSGMHIHISLWKDGKNIFYDPESHGLSETAKSYIAGIIKYGREIQAGLNQWINSYKRLMPGYEAPTYLCWGMKNRSAYIRVPEYQKGKENATRIEVRSPDPACNPYLALTLIHAAGIQGIKEGLKPPAPVEADIFHISDAERKALAVEELNPSLEKALELFEKSALVRSVLPEHLLKKFIENKKIECKKFNKAVTDFEIKNYYPVL